MSKTSRIELGKPAVKGEKILRRRYRLAKRLSRIVSNGGALLDVGCGNGAQTALFEKHFSQIVGVDVQTDPMKDPKITALWVGATGEHLPFDDESFDAITCFEVLEHVVDPVQTVKEFHRLLRPGGQVVLSVPNKWWVFETHGAHLPVLPWNRVPFFSWLPQPLHERWAKARIYTRKRLAETIRTGGFSQYRIFYITAPMDRARPRWLQKILQKTIFSSDLTRIPFISVNHMAVLNKKS